VRRLCERYLFLISASFLIILCATMFTGCRDMKVLKHIPESEIPKEDRDMLVKMGTILDKPPSDIVWHVYEDTEAYLFKAASLRMWPGVKMYYIHFTDKTRGIGGGTMVEDRDNTFFGVIGVRDYLGKPVELETYGVILDSRAVKIVGTSTLGQEVETKPHDGFCVLNLKLKDPEETWKSIKAFDRNGKVTGTMKIQNYWLRSFPSKGTS